MATLNKSPVHFAFIQSAYASQVCVHTWDMVSYEMTTYYGIITSAKLLLQTKRGGGSIPNSPTTESELQFQTFPFTIIIWDFNVYKALSPIFVKTVFLQE